VVPTGFILFKSTGWIVFVRNDGFFRIEINTEVPGERSGEGAKLKQYRVAQRCIEFDTVYRFADTLNQVTAGWLQRCQKQFFAKHHACG
jgi:hypothetical protein